VLGSNQPLGTDDEPTQGGYHGHRDAVPVGVRMGKAKVLDELRELNLDNATAGRLCAMSAARIDRRERKRRALKSRSGTKPGSLLKSPRSQEGQGRPWLTVRPAQPGTDPPRPPGHAGPTAGARPGQAPTRLPLNPPPATRTSAREATKTRTRASWR